MGVGIATRIEFVDRVNHAFSETEIDTTRARLQPFDSAWDHLDILERLGMLSFLRTGQLAAYRRKLGIPAHNQDALTDAFHRSLGGDARPVPLSMQIVSGEEESIEIHSGTKGIEIILTRAEFDIVDSRPSSLRSVQHATSAPASL